MLEVMSQGLCYCPVSNNLGDDVFMQILSGVTKQLI